MNRTRVTALAAALSLSVAGCSSGGSVTGTVTLDGVPLKGGVVTYYPVAAGPVAIGAVSVNGEFELAIGQDRSVPLGDYLVTVEATVSAPFQTQSDPPKPPPPPKRITPDKYAGKDTSD